MEEVTPEEVERFLKSFAESITEFNSELKELGTASVRKSNGEVVYTINITPEDPQSSKSPVSNDDAEIADNKSLHLEECEMEVQIEENNETYPMEDPIGQDAPSYLRLRNITEITCNKKRNKNKALRKSSEFAKVNNGLVTSRFKSYNDLTLEDTPPTVTLSAVDFPRKRPPTCIITLTRNDQFVQCKYCANYDRLRYRCQYDDEDFYLCSLECLRNYFRKLPICQIRNTTLLVVPSKCSSCDNMQSCFEKMLAWQTLHFCDVVCLEKYKSSKMENGCCQCRTKVESVPDELFLRFGRDVRLFCSKRCLELHAMPCEFCHQKVVDIMKDFCSAACRDKYSIACNKHISVELCQCCSKRSRPEKEICSGGISKYFCKQACFEQYIMDLKVINIKVYKCASCSIFYDLKTINEYSLTFDANRYNFCSVGCQNLLISKESKLVSCIWCFRYVSNNKMIVRYSGYCSIYLCSLACMSKFENSSCSTCSQKTATYFHLELDELANLHFCANKCLQNFLIYTLGSKAQDVTSTSTATNVDSTYVQKYLLQASCSNEDKTFSSLQSTSVTSTPMEVTQEQESNLQSLSVNNHGMIGRGGLSGRPNIHVYVASPAKVDMKNVMTMCHVKVQDKSTHTNEKAFYDKEIQTDKMPVERVPYPIPVPIYLPTPMYAWQVPTAQPVTFPLPIPVPLFIPTMRDSQEAIMSDVRRVLTDVPADPVQAEMVHLAEVVARTVPVDFNARDQSSTGSVSEDIGEETEYVDPAEDVDVLVGFPAGKFNYSYGMRAWLNWRNGRSFTEKKRMKVSADLLEICPADLNECLVLFMKQFKKPTGGEYSPDTLYFLCLGMQHHMFLGGRADDIFCDVLYKDFSKLMSQNLAKFHSLQGEKIITRIVESFLWETRQLGVYTPMKLIRTLLYFNSKYFNLHTVEDHMKLTFQNVMKNYSRNKKSGTNNVEIVLRYFPPGQTGKSKKYYVQRQSEDELRCPIRLHEFYLSKCSDEAKNKPLFYLMPEKHCIPDSPVWFTNESLPREELEKLINLTEIIKEINVSRISFET